MVLVSRPQVAIKVIKKSLVTDARHLEQIDVEIKCLTMLSVRGHPTFWVVQWTAIHRSP